jgi:radical SAM protein with 4Fe4S-binding SPASM domain
MKITSSFFQKITFRKLTNAAKVYSSFVFSVLFKMVRRWGFPVSISAEPASVCNLHCPECPVGTGVSTRKGFMDFELYQKTMDELSPYLLNLFLYFQGEPLFHPDFSKFVEYAAVQKKIYTVTSTNGHFLNEPTAISLIKSGLDKLIISLDGADEETYEKYRIGGDFNRVVSNIRQLVELKNEMHSKTPEIVIQFIVTGLNEHQIPEIKRLAQILKVGGLSLKSAQIHDFKNGNRLIPQNRKYSRYRKTSDGSFEIKSRLKNRCQRLWNSAVIIESGDVLPCCFDKSAQYSVGNIENTSFRKINNNEQYKIFRKKIITDRKSVLMCNNCTEGLIL